MKIAKIINNLINAIIIIFALLVLVLSEPFDGKGGDECFYLAYLTSLVYDSDLLFYNDLLASNNPYFISIKMVSDISETGFVKNPYAPGTALLSLPFFLCGTVIDGLVSGSLSHPLHDRFSFFLLLITSISLLMKLYIIVINY